MVAALLTEADEGATVSLTAKGGARLRVSVAAYAADAPLGDLVSLVLDLRQLAAEAEDPAMRDLSARLDAWRLSNGG